MIDLDVYLLERKQLIDQRLAGYMEGANSGPQRLIEALRYSLLGPGKRVRPILVLMTAEACRREEDHDQSCGMVSQSCGMVSDHATTKALSAACAVEMVHAYSLVHDDLPAMDDDDLRRGRPTCHKQFDEATAILVGDALLTLAFQVLSEDVTPAETSVRCSRELSQAAGGMGMVGGQMDDLLGCQREHGTPSRGLAPSYGMASDHATTTDLESIHTRKTAALFRAACVMGAVIGTENLEADARPPLIQPFERFGTCLGLAFQVSDDLLDVEGDAANVGKRVQKDARRGKLTYPGLVGAAESRRRLEELCKEASAIAEALGNAGRYLSAFAQRIQNRTK